MRIVEVLKVIEVQRYAVDDGHIIEWKIIFRESTGPHLKAYDKTSTDHDHNCYRNLEVGKIHQMDYLGFSGLNWIFTLANAAEILQFRKKHVS